MDGNASDGEKITVGTVDGNPFELTPEQHSRLVTISNRTGKSVEQLLGELEDALAVLDALGIVKAAYDDWDDLPTPEVVKRLYAIVDNAVTEVADRVSDDHYFYEEHETAESVAEYLDDLHDSLSNARAADDEEARDQHRTQARRTLISIIELFGVSQPWGDSLHYFEYDRIPGHLRP